MCQVLAFYSLGFTNDTFRFLKKSSRSTRGSGFKKGLFLSQSKKTPLKAPIVVSNIEIIIPKSVTSIFPSFILMGMSFLTRKSMRNNNLVEISCSFSSTKNAVNIGDKTLLSSLTKRRGINVSSTFSDAGCWIRLKASSECEILSIIYLLSVLYLSISLSVNYSHELHCNSFNLQS